MQSVAINKVSLQDISMHMRSISAGHGQQTLSMPDQIVYNPNSSQQLHKKSQHKINLANVFKANQLFSQTDIIKTTPAIRSGNLSLQYDANIFLKSENHQMGRTYKVRGSYFLHLVSSQERRKSGFVLASDGNLGVSCSVIAGLFKTKFTIVVPENCYQHKIDSIKQQGGDSIVLIQTGMDFQASVQFAVNYAKQHNLPFLKAFDDATFFQGYATIAKELVDQHVSKHIDYVLIPTGGGGLACSIASVFKQLCPNTKIISVQPQNCKPYSKSILANKMIAEEKVSRFCNGSSIKQTSKLAYDMGRTSIDGFVQVTEKKLAQKIIKMYSMGLICQPAGCLSIAGLDKIRHLIKGKNVVCIMSGANIDLSKLDQARQMALMSKGQKNFYHIQLPNRKGVIHQLITNCFKPSDIISIQYSRAFGKDSTHLLVSVQSGTQRDVEDYLQKMVESKIVFENVNDKEEILDIFF